MKSIRIFTLILTTAMLFSGCDRIRSMMGKPTSSDLERIRVEKEAQQKAERDSIARAEEAAALEVQAVETTAVKAPAGKSSAKPAVIPATAGSLRRYSVIVGSYLKAYNVKAMTAKMEKAGEKPFVIPFKTGFTGVAVYTTDNFRDAYRKLTQIIATGSVPSDTWIYDTAWGRHQ